MRHQSTAKTGQRELLRWVRSVSVTWLWLITFFAATPAALAETFDYQIDLTVPRPFRELLQNHLDLYTWKGNPRVNEDQLRRLVAAAPDNIRELMATEGYYTPQIDVALVDGPVPVVRIDVEPGDPVHVSQVDLRVTGPFSDGSPANQAKLERMRQDWALKPGRIFKQEDWESAKRDALKKLLVDRYPTAKIDFSRATVNPQTREAALDVQLASGPAFTFGDLQIEGLERYPASIIERLSPFDPGDPYSQTKLLELQSRLQNSPYFSGAFVIAEPQPEGPTQVPVKVRVSENKSKKFGLGVGMSTNTGGRVQVDYRDIDFLDKAWRLQAGVKVEQKRQSISGEIQFPLKASGYQDSVNALLERTDIEGETTRKVGLGAKRTRVRGDIETAFGLQYIAERQTIEGVTTRTNQALVPTYSWTQRKVDNLLFPTRGYIVNVQVGVASKAVLSDQDFVRGYTKSAYFHPAGDKGQLILRGELGMVAAQSRVGIPSDYLFRAGGDQSVRGYAYQSLGVKEGQATVGGRYLAVASAEYVHWIKEKWGAAVFVDAGNAADDLNELSPKVGYGVGARWRSPVGPLAVDLAYGQDAKRFRLHFSVGFSF